MGTTHVIIMATVAAMLVFINYILIGIGHATTSTDIGYISSANIVISIANAYWLVRLSLTSQGVQESTAKQ